MDTVYEPLAETAELARTLAAELCDPEAGCRDYHGSWQYLRLLGLNTTIRSDRAFFIDAFRAAARTGARRVLISGAADYGMLAQLLHAYRSVAVEPECVLVDRCATPLRLNEHYAGLVGARLTTIQADIRQFVTSPVDLVCTHSFFGFIATADRPAVATAWYRLLSPGGKVVTSNSLRPADDDGTFRMRPESIARFRAEVFAAARAWPGLDVDPDALADSAAALRSRRLGDGMYTVEELTAQLTAAGLELERCEVSTARTDVGPFRDARMPRRRVQVVARRPRR